MTFPEQKCTCCNIGVIFSLSFFFFFLVPQIIGDKRNMAATCLCHVKQSVATSSWTKRPPHECVPASAAQLEVFELLLGVPIDFC